MSKTDDCGAVVDDTNGIKAYPGEQVKLFAIETHGRVIDIGLFQFKNRLHIIVTQLGKIGSLVSVRRNRALDGEEREVFEIRTIFGNDLLEYQVVARHIAESLPPDIELLIGIAIPDVTFPIVQAIKAALLANKIW